MDPLTQGTLGAAAALCFIKRDKPWAVALAGTVGGMAADADIFIRSAVDPLLEIEYHRHFTHSLAFIPFGGLIVACLLWVLLRRHMSFARIFFFATLGYATHGLLDACTSYGTRLFWPFSDVRVAWNVVSIIDPLYTLPLLFFVVAAVGKKSATWARVGFLISVLYLLAGFVQRERALYFQTEVATARGHVLERRVVHPTFANLLLWRSTYAAGGFYYVDGLRIGLTKAPKLYEGTSVTPFDLNQQADIPPESVLAKDIVRFGHFSDGWLYAVPGKEHLISDLRYSILPNTASPLWAIEVDPALLDVHAPFLMMQRVGERDWSSYWGMLRGYE